MPKRWFVYGLYDPREPARVRYIGVSADPEARFRGHLAEARLRHHIRTHKAQWIRSLLAVGMRPALREFSEWPSRESAMRAEVLAIARAKLEGERLTNATIGGEGVSGGPFTQAHKDSIGRANKGKLKGRVWSPAQRAQISASLKGRQGVGRPKGKGMGAPLTEAHKQAISKAMRRRSRPPS